MTGWHSLYFIIWIYQDVYVQSVDATKLMRMRSCHLRVRRAIRYNVCRVQAEDVLTLKKMDLQ